MCSVLLLPGGYPIADDKYINLKRKNSLREKREISDNTDVIMVNIVCEMFSNVVNI
jgi:hypothetical protein